MIVKSGLCLLSLTIVVMPNRERRSEEAYKNTESEAGDNDGMHQFLRNFSQNDGRGQDDHEDESPNAEIA